MCNTTLHYTTLHYHYYVNNIIFCIVQKTQKNNFKFYAFSDRLSKRYFEAYYHFILYSIIIYNFILVFFATIKSEFCK